MKQRRNFWLLLLIAMAGAITLSFVDRQKLAVLFDRAALTGFFESAGYSGVCYFICAHIIANAVGIPGTLLVVVGGAAYGVWWGAVWSVLGATLGAIAAFWLARYLLHSWFKNRFSHRPLLQRLNRALCSNGLACVLTVRFSPVSPFNVVNFAFGLTHVSVQSYALGTLIGIIPGTLAYTWLGATGAEALDGGSLAPLFACLILLALLSASPLLHRQLIANSKQTP